MTETELEGRRPDASNSASERLIEMLFARGASVTDMQQLISRLLDDSKGRVDQAVRLEWGGLIAGLVCALSFLGVSAWIISTGHATAGTVIATTDVVGLVAVFVYGRNARAKQLKEPLHLPK